MFVSKADLEATRLSTPDLRTIAAEIKAFEDQHKEDGDFDAIEFLRGETEEGEPEVQTAKKTRSRRRKPGARNPFRDHVGDENLSNGDQDSTEIDAKSKPSMAKEEK